MKKHKSRNKKIKELWEHNEYTKAEIGRRLNLTRERVRQILKEVDADNPYGVTTDRFNWEAFREIKKILKIPRKNSTWTMLENEQGIYSEPRNSKAAVEYFVYTIQAIEDALVKLDTLLNQINWPDDETY